MSNTGIDSISSDLKFFSRSLLMYMKQSLGWLRRLPRDDAAMSAPGLTKYFPFVEILGGATTRTVPDGALTASSTLSGNRALSVGHDAIGISLDAIQMDVSAALVNESLAARLASRLVEKVASRVTSLWSLVGYETGELDGTAAFNSTDILLHLSTARFILSSNGVPTDDLVCVLNPREAMNLRNLSALYKVNEAGSAVTLREGASGNIYNFDVWESQAIQSATLAAAAETASPGAVVGAHLVGAVTLSVNSIGAGTVKKGTTLTIAGVVNQISGSLVGFSVTADTAIAGNAAVLPIFPELPAALSGSEAVTFVEHTAAGSMNLCFNPQAFTLGIRPPAPWPAGSGIASEVVTDEESNIGVRVSLRSTLLGGAGVAFQNELACDVIAGASLVEPTAAVKLTGKL